VVAERQPALVSDPASDPRFFGDVDAASEFVTTDLLAVPLLSSDEAVGVLEVVNKLGDEGTFGDADVALARGFASLATIALERSAR
jgi:phosphoserine phosphatase RsbU/P